MRTLAIGDIHGCFNSLDALLGTVAPRPDDTLLFMGDYIDRGPRSKDVLDLLIKLSSESKLIPLLGNHELMMLRARDDRAAILEWCHYGGSATLDSYRATRLSDIPEAHWDFLSKCLKFHETSPDFFVHANAFPNVALADQPDFMLLWEHLGNSLPHQSGKRMICGHTPQRRGIPLNLGHAVCIDTFAHGGGWLTCLEVETGRFWQANENKMTRNSTLDDIKKLGQPGGSHRLFDCQPPASADNQPASRFTCNP